MDAAMLLEREQELAALERALSRAVAGDGMLVLVEGPAGIGKTALLDSAGRLAGRESALVLRALGTELEGDYPFGIVRQLLEPTLRDRSPEELRELLSGVTEPAAPVVARPGQGQTAGEPALGQDGSFAVLRALYWLVVELATRRPLVLLVDDGHWADSASLRFLLYLAHRLDGLAVLLAVSVRSGDPSTDAGLLADLRSHPQVQTLRPAPLSVGAVTDLIAETLSEEPDDAFAAACHGTTGGVPFLIRELCTTLAAERIPPTADSIGRVEQLGGEAVAPGIMLRLSKLAPGSVALAVAVTILGGEARLPACVRLADLGDEDALAALDALVDARILERSSPLRFAHPLVGAAVYQSLSTAERSALHGRAAELLAAEGAPPDAVAVHLVNTEPLGREHLARQLREAAGLAVAQGATESAVAFLRRALQEGVDRRLRAEVVYELGRAEALLRDPSAFEHLREAQRLMEDPVRRALIGGQLSEMLAFVGQWDASIESIESAVAEVGDRDDDLRLHLLSIWAAHLAFDQRRVADFDRRRAELSALAERGGPAARSLNLLLAGVAAARGEDLPTALAMVERGLDGGRYIADHGSDSAILPQGLAALILSERLDRADQVCEEMLADARSRGSEFGFATATAHRAWAAARRGDLRSAEAEGRSALESLLGRGIVFGGAVTIGFFCDAVIERPDLADVAALAEQLEIPPTMAPLTAGCYFAAARGRMRLAAGARAEGEAELRGIADSAARLDLDGGYFAPEEALAALALATTDQEEASGLVDRLFEIARRTGLPRQRGIALRTAGQLAGGGEGIEQLRHAVEVLQGSPARLESARALVELGAALRRANRRASAREPLREGLDLAEQCGAVRLAEQAATELAATGARPRRRRTTGRDALTPSEERIARMAADGLSNRAIAQALFVTPKTVENQLGRVYRKLGIHSRTQLQQRLGTTRSVDEDPA